jgi:hypothetical protein
MVIQLANTLPAFYELRCCIHRASALDSELSHVNITHCHTLFIKDPF